MADSTYLSDLGKLTHGLRVMPWEQIQLAILCQVFGSDTLTTRVSYIWAMSRSVRDEGEGSG